MRSTSWILKITLMSAVLGVLLAASLKTQATLRNEGLPARRWTELVSAYKDTKEHNEKLQQQIAKLQTEKTDLENRLGRGDNSTKALNEQLQETKFLAGLSSAEGPGIVVVLQDSKKKPAVDAPWMVQQESIIHDSDIRNVVNELRAAGAEIVSVNGQRLIATSAIRCRGPVIQVNGVEMASPYEIKAIGDPKTLEGALRINNGIVDSFTTDTSMIEIRQEKSVVIQPYSGSTQFNYAKSAKD